MNTFLSTTIEFWPVEKVIPYLRQKVSRNEI
jgi:hypothetical protein